MQSDASAFQDGEIFPELLRGGAFLCTPWEVNRVEQRPGASWCQSCDSASHPEHLVGIRRFTTLGVILPKTLTVGGLGGHPMMGVCHQVFQTF